MGLTRINNQALTDVTSAGLPSGSVLQVESVSHNTEYDITSTSGQDIGLSITITPTSATSEFLLTGSIGINGASGNYFGIKLFRDSTEIGGGSGKTYNGYKIWYPNSSSSLDNRTVSSLGINFLDDPDTASSITYKVQAFVSGGTGGINHRNSSDDTNITSQFTLMEIAG
jgi:hypothetical protein